MHDDRQRVDAVAVDQHVDLDDVGRAVLLELVVHRRVAARHALQLVEEVEHDLGQRQLVGQMHLAAVVGHVELDAALLVGQRHHRADVVLRHVQVHRDDRLADLADAARSGIFDGFSTLITVAVVELDLVDHADGAVVIRSWSNSRSSRSCTISMCSRPRKPQRKPKPSAWLTSGS